MRNDIMSPMREVLPLEGKPKRRWTAIFVSVVIAITLVCFGVMNVNYDALARYPYKDQKSRQKIREKLNNQEIEYIIEYSIPPNMFISFIDAPGFSIYHAAEYKELSKWVWQVSPETIVKYVEETRNYISVSELVSYLSDGNYNYDTIHTYLTEGDPYQSEATLVKEAYLMDTWLDDDTTVMDRVPSLMTIDPSLTKNGATIYLHPEANLALNELLNAVHDATGIDCKVEEGYISYNECVEDYENNESSFLPGHNEHQLGLAVDLCIDGLSDKGFVKTKAYTYLVEHAQEYGFVFTYDGEGALLTGQKKEVNHLRYVGNLASTLKAENTSFAAYGMSQKENSQTESSN